MSELSKVFNPLTNLRKRFTISSNGFKKRAQSKKYKDAPVNDIKLFNLEARSGTVLTGVEDQMTI